jgi:hypothetical protein
MILYFKVSDFFALFAVRSSVFLVAAIKSSFIDLWVAESDEVILPLAATVAKASLLYA